MWAGSFRGEQRPEFEVPVLVGTPQLARLMKKAAVPSVASMCWGCPSRVCVLKKQDVSEKLRKTFKGQITTCNEVELMGLGPEC